MCFCWKGCQRPLRIQQSLKQMITSYLTNLCFMKYWWIQSMLGKDINWVCPLPLRPPALNYSLDSRESLTASLKVNNLSFNGLSFWFGCFWNYAWLPLGSSFQKQLGFNLKHSIIHSSFKSLLISIDIRKRKKGWESQVFFSLKKFQSSYFSTYRVSQQV